MNELTLSQQKVLHSDYIRDDINNDNDDDNDMHSLLQITNVSMDDDDPLLQFAPQRIESNSHQQNLMEMDDTTDWMTEDDDDDWLMQDSPLHDLPSDQSSTPTVMPASPFSPRNIWEIVSSVTNNIFEKYILLKR